MTHLHRHSQDESELLDGAMSSSSTTTRSTTTSSSSPSRNSKKKKYFLLLTSSFLLLALVASVVALVSHARANRHGGAAADTTPAHGVLRAACSSTLYPDLCYSSIADNPSLLTTVNSQKDVIHGSINISRDAVQHSYFRVQKLRAARAAGLPEREREALHDCLEMFDDTLDELRKAEADLSGYNPGAGSKTLARHAADLETLLSAAMTNQESCLDGFSHDGADRRIRKGLKGAVEHVSHMCSNALAMVINMTDGDIAAAELAEKKSSSGRSRRLLMDDVDDEGFPEWMTAADRRLLQATTVTPDVVVAADGSGNYRTVAAAVAAAPEKSSRRYVIGIKAGTYRENVDVPKKKTNIMFVGDDRTTTIITGSRNVVDGSTTFHSATVAAVGEKFLARDLTFQNTAGPSKHQAVALRVGSDLSAFYRCNIVAYQDTLYVHSLRQFFRDCYISGTVDFIFGNAAVVLQSCNIQARRPNGGQKNMVTAQGRADPNQNTGIVIQGCTISASSDLAPVVGSFPTFLGRPWKAYSRTMVMQSTITNVISPAGWHEWSGTFALNTLTYREYQNTGAGAGTASRVNWKGYKAITSAAEAQPYTPANFIAGSGWLGSTGFPFLLGL
ncbi:hypothetical protein Taro_012652 [Colocasia esculenta]|uniref:Pectinesterase n=1 Tax=Colocasia esculenta TaxID=4460 RepID=A0A843UE59_COLES|nr:hypothetical protein [Colocasia esculenta]